MGLVKNKLEKMGKIIRPDKCQIGKSVVKWFGNIYPKFGVSPDPQKCAIIKDWPTPKSTSEVKSFLQTIQFNSKIFGEEPRKLSYLELTEPLLILNKEACKICLELRRLCSERVLVP